MARSMDWRECPRTGDLRCLRAACSFGSIVVTVHGATFFVWDGATLRASDLFLKKPAPLRSVAAMAERFLASLEGSVHQ